MTTANRCTVNNEYLRSLAHQPSPMPREWQRQDWWQTPHYDGAIIVTTDGHRLRVERTPAVPDLVAVGDIIRLNYPAFHGGGGGIVIRITRNTYCTCPRDPWGTRLCDPHPGYNRPAIPDYHIPITSWRLVFVDPRTARRNRRGEFYDQTDHQSTGDIIAAGARLLALFENNDMEVFVTQRAALDIPVQLNLFGGAA